MDDFDDMGAMRRKVCDLQQKNGDLGEQIATLKQERARLWLALNSVLAFCPDESIHPYVAVAGRVHRSIEIS